MDTIRSSLVTSASLYPQEVFDGIREALRLTGGKERKQGKKIEYAGSITEVLPWLLCPRWCPSRTRYFNIKSEVVARVSKPPRPYVCSEGRPRGR